MRWDTGILNIPNLGIIKSFPLHACVDNKKGLIFSFYVLDNVLEILNLVYRKTNVSLYELDSAISGLCPLWESVQTLQYYCAVYCLEATFFCGVLLQDRIRSKFSFLMTQFK